MRLAAGVYFLAPRFYEHIKNFPILTTITRCYGKKPHFRLDIRTNESPNEADSTRRRRQLFFAKTMRGSIKRNCLER